MCKKYFTFPDFINFAHLSWNGSIFEEKEEFLLLSHVNIDLQWIFPFFCLEIWTVHRISRVFYASVNGKYCRSRFEKVMRSFHFEQLGIVFLAHLAGIRTLVESFWLHFKAAKVQVFLQQMIKIAEINSSLLQLSLTDLDRMYLVTYLRPEIDRNIFRSRVTR